MVKLDCLNFAQLMKVDDSFCQKRLLFAGWVEFVTLPLRRLQLWKTLGKSVRLFHKNKQIKHKGEGAKMVLMMGGMV